MRKLVTLVIVLLALDPPPTIASDGGLEVCSLIYLKGGADPVCHYRSFQQCEAAISGLGGTCINNPYFKLKTRSESTIRR